MRKLALIFLLLPGLCRAGGYAFYEMSAAAGGQANAYICRVDDPSAVWYNPAALVNLEGNQFSVGSTWLHTEADFTSNLNHVTFKAEPQNLLPIHAFYSHQFSDGLVLGFGAYTPYVFKFQWPEQSTVSYLSATSELRTLYFTPSVGYRISPNLSVGGGFDLVYADTTSAVNIPETNYGSEINADTIDFGFNLGALIDTNSNVKFAITYKSKVDLNMDGDVSFSGALPGTLPTPAFVLPIGEAHIDLPVPEQVMLGASTTYENWDFEVNLIWVNWDRFDNLRIAFDRNNIIVRDLSIPREWHDTWSARLGAEYHWSDELSLKGGYIHDATPQPLRALDPIFADADRTGFALGIGWNDPKWGFDVGYTHLFFEDRTSPPDNFLTAYAAGKYTQSHDVLTVGFEYRWE